MNKKFGENMNQYDIVFYKGKSPISNIIKMFTKSKYSHVALVLDKYHLFETNWSHPAQINHIKYRTKDYDIYRYKSHLTNRQKVLIDDYIQSVLDSKYDFKFLFSRGLKILFNVKIKDDKSRMTCDELVYLAFKNAGIDLLEGLDKTHILSPNLLSKSKLLHQIK